MFALVSFLYCLALFWHHACTGAAICGKNITDADEGSINTSITLRCAGCPRREAVQWHLELDGEESLVADANTRRLNVFVTESSGGSIYRCECGLHVECHIILVHPYFTKDFGPLESAFVRSGDTFTLVCEADGFPRPKQENFSLSGPRTLFRQERLVPTTSGVSLEVSNASKENHSGVYHCIVNTEWTTEMIPGFRFTGQIASSTTLTVYDPPLLRGTTNSTVCAKLSSSERSAATLECAVQERDGEARVQWARGGQVLRSSAKYVIPKEPIREAGGMLVFLLIVRELTEADVGAYECQLFSNFSGNRPEATRRVWINLGDDNDSPTIDESESVSITVFIIVIVFLGLLVAIILLLAIMMALCVARHYKRRGYNPASQNDLGLSNRAANVNAEVPRYAPLPAVPDEIVANGDTGAPPHTPPPDPPAPTQAGETENQDDVQEHSSSLSASLSPREQPATAMDVTSQGEGTVDQRRAVGTQPEPATGSGGMRGEEETPTIPPQSLARSVSQSSTSSIQDPSPLSPRICSVCSRQIQEKNRSPLKHKKRLNPSESSPLPSPRSSLTWSSISTLLKRRGSEMNKSQEPLYTPDQADTTSSNDSDDN